MKGGQTPIHLMKLATADYLNDPWVKLALFENNLAASAFYPVFLFASHLHGGDLPADPTRLAAAIGMRRDVVVRALAFWTRPECGLVVIDGGRAWNPRVRRDVKAELAFREEQAERGRKGGMLAGKGRPKADVRQPPISTIGPPSPTPAPAPAPTPGSTNGGAGGRADASISRPPAPPASVPGVELLDHDPSDPVETRLASRIDHLARIGLGAPLEILEAVSATPAGNFLDHVRGAPSAWLEATIRACDAFESDNTSGDEPQTEGRTS
jgi:hypothetical protein